MAGSGKDKLANYECEGQMTMDMFMATKRPPEYGERGCHVCEWWNNRSDIPGCYWNDEYWLKGGCERQVYPNCKFMPDSAKIEKMCANCEHCNQFVFQDKPEHKDNHRKSMYDPVDEPNIYCTHREGSLNRHTAYKEFEKHKFGVGLYHRQHEWDTCDRWEPEIRR